MSEPVNELGNTYGRLTVIGRAPGGGWTCRCSCGTECRRFGTELRRGKVVSCGCRQREIQQGSPITHGGTNHQLYRTWTNIKQRTTNPNNENFPSYGGRGIKLCESWVNDFGAFRDWVEANIGARPAGKTLDRINTDGDYEPGNLRWATNVEQQQNKRSIQQLQRERDALLALVLRILEIE